MCSNENKYNNKKMGGLSSQSSIQPAGLDQPSTPNNNINIGGITTQMQKDKQLVKQKISQEYTADILGKALTYAEHYSSRFGKDHFTNFQFNYYNIYDSGINKDKQSLKKGLISLLNVIQTYYELDGKCFPKGIKIKEVQDYLTKLKSNCKEEDQQIFDAFILILDGKQFDFSSFFNTQNAHVDPNMLTSKGIKVMKGALKQEKTWEKKALEEGDYDVGLQIGKDWKENKNVPDLDDDYGY